ncbi:MAG: hypothetical protein JWN27_1014 [Candidatus Eremiobacteraeota bacterium]|jgi:hypothetical protein|nr:hypothetical protein [Candidatus Eremiobacteraeota bacterium]
MPHRLKIIDHNGHTELGWNPQCAEETEAVRERFDALMRRNFVAFDLSNSPGEVIREFRPESTELLITPKFVGG